MGDFVSGNANGIWLDTTNEKGNMIITIMYVENALRDSDKHYNPRAYQCLSDCIYGVRGFYSKNVA